MIRQEKVKNNANRCLELHTGVLGLNVVVFGEDADARLTMVTETDFLIEEDRVFCIPIFQGIHFILAKEHRSILLKNAQWPCQLQV